MKPARKQPVRRQRGYYLSTKGYTKIWAAINNQHPDGCCLSQLKNLDVPTPLPSEKTISRILHRKDRTDRTSIDALFQQFELNLNDEDLTQEEPKEIKVIQSREDLIQAGNHNLPRQNIPFIGRKNGRKQELQELLYYLSDEYAQPIIQIDGIGGVGKTALALEAAYLCLEKREKVQSTSTDEDYTVPEFGVIIWTSAKEYELLSVGIGEEIQAQRTLQEIYRTIADVFDDPTLLDDDTNRQTNGRTNRQHHNRIINKLKNQPKKNLLIIDNLETIIDIKKVLSFAQKLHNTKTVITTREQAYIFTHISLKPLNAKESLALIDQQLRNAKFVLNERSKKRLFEASNGIPLAIIYSIGRLSNQSQESFNPDWFDLVLEDLTSEDGDLPRFCFQKLVNEIEKENKPAYWLLMAIAIFEKAPRRDAIVEVAGLSAEISSTITRQLNILEVISFVHFHNNRYWMLPITREYVLVQLIKNAEFKKFALERWVNFYLQLAQEQYENQPKDERRINYYNTLDDEWKNFLGVLRFCKDNNDYQKVKQIWNYLNNYANTRGKWGDRLFWLGWLIDNSKSRREYQETVGFMVRKARILLLIGTPHDLRAAKKLFLDAWELKQYASFDDIDYLTNHLAAVYARLGNYQEAHKWLDEQQKNIDRCKDDKLSLYQIYVDRERAELFFVEGNYEQSAALCHQVIREAKKIEDIRNENYASKILADIAIKDKKFDTAERLLNLGLDEVKTSIDKRRIAYYLVSLCLLEKEKGNISEAKKLLSQATNHFKYLGMMFDLEKTKKIRSELSKS